MTFKNIKIKMKGGKSRMQRVQVLASGKYKFVKNIRGAPKKSKSSNPRPKPKARKVKRKMAKKRRRNNAMTIPLAVVTPLVAGFVGPTVYGPGPLQAILEGNYGDAMNRLSVNFTGFNFDDGTWDINRANALKGTIIGLLIHKFVGGAPLNLNRILARAKVPFIRI